jgi:DNA-binding response OmpR family regulator
MQDAPQTLQGLDPAHVKTVLIVEDDVDIGEVLTAILEDTTAYRVIYVPDGFVALKLVQTLIPQLILLDYLLPGMDGLACLDLLRASKGMEQTPIILMSAAFPEGVQTRTDLALLEKPFEMKTLLALIRQLLES